MTNDELIDKTNKAIAELVYPKKELQKAYNYYNGIRDADQFKYLEENFGLGNPTSIEFTPLIKKHIDALIGEYLGNPIIPKIQCKDVETITNIGREKQLKIVSEVHQFLTANLKKSMLNFIDQKDPSDPLIEKQLQQLVDDINNSFISEYEIAAQNIVEWIMQSRSTDIVTKLRGLMLDLLVGGEPSYKVESTVEKNNIHIRQLDPRNTFFDYNPDSIYLKDSYRVVVRNWMTKTQVLNKYGRELTKKEIDKINDHWDTRENSGTYYINHDAHGHRSIVQHEVVVPGYPDVVENNFNEFIAVYEVEWLETDSNFVMQRYETIRIGDDIFILKGKNEDVIRSKDNPSYCSLSVNGIRFLNRNTKPHSLVLACANLQDKYDILIFYRDRLIANSGTSGDFLDISLLPTFLGQDTPERLQKYIAYKKSGLALIDSSQPGRLENGGQAMNTMFNGFDDTVKVQSIQAIQTAIQSIEETVSSITGVFRERLNGIEQRDAVSNIKVGQNNSFIITKQYYHSMDLIVNEILLDSLNLAKSVYKNGLTGTLILGDKYQKIFTALPQHFTLTDFDIRIVTTSDVIKDLEYIKQLIPDLAKSGIISSDIIFDALTTKSLTELKTKAKISMQKQKEENNQIMQLSQKLQETENQFKQCTQELQKAQKKIEQLNESKMQLEAQKIQLQYKVDWFMAQTDRTYKSTLAEEAKKRTEIEEQQLYDGNPYNDKVKRIGL